MKMNERRYTVLLCTSISFISLVWKQFFSSVEEAYIFGTETVERLSVMVDHNHYTQYTVYMQVVSILYQKFATM